MVPVTEAIEEKVDYTKETHQCRQKRIILGAH